ncbi:Endoplasmin-like protein [Hordeum vulgare]|nr:Endoplasmin-like protein [Hordeum vulgare]
MATSGAGEEHHHHGPGGEPSVRIEDLPTEILHAIVSLLPLKEAVRTSILSTSWKMLWTFHCNLCFYGPNETDHDPLPRLESYGPDAFREAFDEYLETQQAKLKIKRDKFIEDVNCVIQRHSGVGVSKFSIRCGLHKEDFGHLDRWISFAALSRAKIVDFDLKKNPSKEVNQFPLEALVVQGSSSRVQSLYLADASIKPHSRIRGFTVLRRLVLEFVEIFGDFPGFLANCSALEDLEMIECSGVTNLSIPQQLHKLQHLLIDGMDVETVESHAADLAHFEYKGKEIPIILHGRSKLEKATIMFEGSNGLARVFTAVPIILRVKMLKVEALIFREQLGKLTPRPDHIFIHLRHMTCEIAFIFASLSVLQLARCLDVAPQLETLDLNMFYPDSRVWVHDDLVVEEGPHMRRHEHLKTVYISGFRCYAGQTKLACCILENACVLEHMRIQPRFLTRTLRGESWLNDGVRGRFLPEAREWAQVTSERFGKVITVLDDPSE